MNLNSIILTNSRIGGGNNRIIKFYLVIMGLENVLGG